MDDVRSSRGGGTPYTPEGPVRESGSPPSRPLLTVVTGGESSSLAVPVHGDLFLLRRPRDRVSLHRGSLTGPG